MFKIVVIILAVLNVMPQHVSSAGGTITAAVIGASVNAAGIVSKSNPNVQPGEKGGCYWKGTAPACSSPSCNRNAEEEEFIKLGKLSYLDPIGINQTPNFGANCWYGKKTLCCKGRGHDNTWAGIWEVAFLFTIQRCKNVEDQDAACGMNLKCIDDNDNENTWEIGGSNCDRLFWKGTEEAEVYPGIIAWKKQLKVGKAQRWFKVNPGS